MIGAHLRHVVARPTERLHESRDRPADRAMHHLSHMIARPTERAP